MIRVNRQGEVWVFAEQEDGKLNEVSLELCGKARQLADELQVPAGAILVGCLRGIRRQNATLGRPDGKHRIHSRD